ncbi:MAG: hypothetical protein NTZ87_00525 [Candidatus Nomurabacteria bacterium]|nr:hypothetical protein [Candidatus Nomurabacteria bacterium]
METKNIKYPYLPEGRTILYVAEDNPFMVEAKKEAEKSNDHNTPTGAVIVSNGKIISRAHNKASISNPKLINLHKKYCIRKMLGIASGYKYWLCPGCATNSSHAEYRAVVNLQEQGVKDFNDLELYLWGHWWCCKPCWDKMIEAGIKNVYLTNND